MFKKILQTILSRGTVHKSELAKEVGVQTATLNDMFRILLERGYLRLADCDVIEADHCSSCPSSAGCHTDDALGKAYYVTEKGKRFAEA
ncbi:MAG: winged helix-turn-helix domain-containing protein [Candidatus Thorarchaeota archaeon]